MLLVGYVESGSYKKHLRTHTNAQITTAHANVGQTVNVPPGPPPQLGTKNYACTLCPKSYTQGQNLKKHMASHGLLNPVRHHLHLYLRFNVSFLLILICLQSALETVGTAHHIQQQMRQQQPQQTQQQQQQQQHSQHQQLTTQHQLVQQQPQQLQVQTIQIHPQHVSAHHGQPIQIHVGGIIFKLK